MIWPSPVDTLQSLNWASGHFIIHFAYFIAIFFVARSKDDKLKCSYTDEDGLNNVQWFDLNMNKCADNLQKMHLFVFLGQITGKYLESKNLNYHTSVFFHLVSISVYVYIILIITYDIYNIILIQNESREKHMLTI